MAFYRFFVAPEARRAVRGPVRRQLITLETPDNACGVSGATQYKSGLIGPWIAALLLTVSLAFAPAATAAPQGSRFGPDYFTNLSVTTQDGVTAPFYDAFIKGKIVVFTFIYLNCNDICPLTTSRIAKIAEKLGDAVGRDVFIYSITMDPTRDTPEALKMHAEAFGARPGWTFLTGKPEDIDKIRWLLGERSRKLTEHRNDMILGNDVTGEWSRTSVYSDIDVAVQTIRELSPAWRAAKQAPSTAIPETATYRLDKRPGEALFRKACASCHSIGGGDAVGPDLKDIAARRNPDWLQRFLLAPDKMRAERDPLTVALGQKYRGVLMPNLGLKANDIADLLAYIEGQSRSPDPDIAAGRATPRTDATGG
jgi:cytochrome oxidase Cu insertion factor (SCO1/SenC/PrrC family)/mono/diheme cytochrome c family protein